MPVGKVTTAQEAIEKAIISLLEDKNRELTLEIIASQAIGDYQYWLKNSYEIDVEYVKGLIRKTIEVYEE